MSGLRLIVVVAALALAGCASESSVATRQDTASTPSAFTGSTLIPSGPRTANPTATGTIGGSVVANLDDRDRRRAYAAEMQALEHGEPGEPVGWRSEASGRHGTIVPGANYERGGTRCRDFSHTVYIDGRPQISRNSACRNPDGSWSPVS